MGKKGRWGGGWAFLGPKGGARAAGPAGVGPRRGRERKRGERERKRKRKKRFSLFFEIRSFYMNAFALSNNQRMHSSAWCSKQKKVFLGFYFTRDLKPKPAITLEKIKV